jgi:hypothetical protein
MKEAEHQTLKVPPTACVLIASHSVPLVSYRAITARKSVKED